MITFLKNGYSEREIFILKHLLLDASNSLMETWIECESNDIPKSEFSCEHCNVRTLCNDLKSTINYIHSLSEEKRTIDYILEERSDNIDNNSQSQV